MLIFRKECHKWPLKRSWNKWPDPARYNEPVATLFEKLIYLQQHVWLTSGLLRWEVTWPPPRAFFEISVDPGRLGTTGHSACCVPQEGVVRLFSLELLNDCGDGVHIWWVDRGLLDVAFPKVMRRVPFARAHVHIPDSSYRSRKLPSRSCSTLWCLVRETSAFAFPRIRDGGLVHVHRQHL